MFLLSYNVAILLSVGVDLKVCVNLVERKNVERKKIESGTDPTRTHVIHV